MSLKTQHDRMSLDIPPCFPHRTDAEPISKISSAIPLAILGVILTNFLPHITTLVVNFWDKIAFDYDAIGRKRTILMMNEKVQAEYGRLGRRVNVAIWNMHLREDHHFEAIIESGMVPMGNGGGFRIVTFLGAGWIRNRGDGGFENWCCSGNQWKDSEGGLITFGKI